MNWVRSILFICLFACVIHCEPCIFTEGEFYSYTDVLNCFHSIYLTDDVKFTTLTTLNRSLELYAFYDIAHDSPDPNLPLNVLMQRGLLTIANRPYVYDIDFHSDLRYLFLQVRDENESLIILCY